MGCCVCLFVFLSHVCVLHAKSLQSYPALCDHMDCSLQISLSMGFSMQGYWSGLPFPSPEDLPNPGIQPRSPTLQVDSLPSDPPGKPKNTGMGSLFLLQGISRVSSQPRNWTWVSCISSARISGRFFTSWATREAQPYIVITFNHQNTSAGIISILEIKKLRLQRLEHRAI